MRVVLGLVVFGACGFQISPGTKPASDADAIEDSMVVDAETPTDAPEIPIDAPIDAAVTIDASPCNTSPLEIVNPATDWEISEDGMTWTAVALPSTGWPCDNCTRYFRTTVCGQPEVVRFRFASDNRARMHVNGTVAFDQYWIAGYCTDQLCCSRCCDSAANCIARLSTERTLGQQGLALFTASTTNTVMWEVREEVGGAGFHTLMTIEY